jgi:hypothetical protein
MEYYVDNSVQVSGDGTSWGQAWGSLAAIDWSVIGPGDVIRISGGASQQTYQETLVVNASGNAEDGAVTITRGIDPGHDGEVVISGDNEREYGVIIDDHDHVVVSCLQVEHITEAGFRVRDANAGVVLKGNAVYSGDPGGGNARGYDVRDSVGDNAVIVTGNSFSTPSHTTAQTDGIWSSGNDGVVFEKNYIVISNNDITGHSDGFQSFLDINITVRGNWFEQANTATTDNHGAWMENTRSGGLIRFHDNVVITPNLTDDASVAHYRTEDWSENGAAEIWNNTIIGGETPIYLGNSPDATVYGNVIVTPAAMAAEAEVHSSDPAGTLQVDALDSPDEEEGATLFTTALEAGGPLPAEAVADFAPAEAPAAGSMPCATEGILFA